MEIITGLDFKLKNSSVSLGKFDGIHLGHRFLLQEVIQQENQVSTAFTFESKKGISKIYTQKEKDCILRGLGMEREIIFPFNDKIKKMAPEEFVRRILVEKMDVKHICVGTDFRFGKDREGDIHLLEQLQKEYGYTLTAVPKLTDEQGIISSTRIRSLMDSGKISEVNRLLGAPYFMMGRVGHGNELGRKMDMPTANLRVEKDKKLLPYGVYATKVKIHGKEYNSVTNIGKKPTVGEYSVGAETYIMDFCEDIYGETIQVFFYEFIRPEKKFNSMEELQCQLKKDKETACFYHQKMFEHCSQASVLTSKKA